MSDKIELLKELYGVLLYHRFDDAGNCGLCYEYSTELDNLFGWCRDCYNEPVQCMRCGISTTQGEAFEAQGGFVCDTCDEKDPVKY